MYRQVTQFSKKAFQIMIKIDKREIFTIPNIITYIRIMMIPFICVLFFEGRGDVALWLSVVFWLADIVDGYLARSLNQVTNLGKMLDPIVDKLFQFSFICCASLMSPGIFVLCALQFVKELILAIIAGVAMYRYGIHESSRWYGKLNTGLLNASIIILLLFPFIEGELLFMIVLINSISLVFSFVLYFIYYLRLIKQRRAKDK